MYNKTEIIATAVLNSGSLVVVDPAITYNETSESGEVNSGSLFPQQIKIVNSSGGDLEWNVMSNADEYIEYQDDPTNFDLVLLPSTVTLEDTGRFYRCEKFLIQKVSGETVTADLRIDFINYAK